MFDLSVEAVAAMTSTQLAAAISDNHLRQVEAENQTLLYAAGWADKHSFDPSLDPDADPDTGPDTGPGAERGWSPLVERWRLVGGDGTPEIGEFCPAELGALLGTGMIAAQALIADALDLRHRFPLIWERIRHGQVRAWKARKIADATRRLSWDAAAEVDTAVAGLLELLPWPRFLKILDAAIVDADPVVAAEREAAAKARREVYATRSVEGLKTIIIRATTGDAVVFMATLNRIADILSLEDAAQGRDPDTIEIRRSRAVGILAQPAKALALLLKHRNDPEPTHPTAGPEPAAGPDLDPEPDPEVEPEPPEPEPALHETDGLDPSELEPEPEHEPEPGAETEHEWEPEPERSGLLLPDLPAGLNAACFGPRVVLHFHLSDLSVRDGYGLARPGDHSDPISVHALKTWLTDTGCPITIRPILDPDQIPAVDRYEVPNRMRAALAVRDIADVFPYGSLCQNTDMDHTQPYDPNGPPGQTRLDNLGPLSRSSHRAATIGGWRKRQPHPGTYLWRSPHGWIWIVTNQGTLNLGRSPFSNAVWQAAKPTPSEAGKRASDPVTEDRHPPPAQMRPPRAPADQMSRAPMTTGP